MSRSYKHVPCWTDHTKGEKRLANKKVRRSSDLIPSGNFYKKIYCSWNICEFRFVQTFNSYKKSWTRRESSEWELYWEWYKLYKMK